MRNYDTMLRVKLDLLGILTILKTNNTMLLTTLLTTLYWRVRYGRCKQVAPRCDT